jgi:UDP-N-acetylmuramate: L-alanyl-gamma-D-glutamyl-meso-diaminopimelate ligase
MKQALPWALASADHSVCHSAGLGWNPADALLPLGQKAVTVDNVAAVVDAVLHVAQAGDHVVCMSNGGFGGVHDKLLSALQHRAKLGQT